MKISTQIAQLMGKEMDRKDFLKYSGGVLLAVIGITGLLHTLTQFGGGTSDENGKDGGYGSSPYGR